MPHHYAGPPTPEWLAGHSAGYIATVKLLLKPADMPRHPDGSIDLQAIPERIFGAEHVVRHPDGSMDLVNVPERDLRPVSRVLHRATCETLRTLGDEFQVIAGTREELERDVLDENDTTCPVCL
jgi:hypothetical protein